jgi:hypothetical protein
MDLESLKYPIGRFQPRPSLTPHERSLLIAEIAALPRDLDDVVSGLDDAQLDRVYRPGGWTVRQVVHHIPDSHLNAYVRCKLALTEDEPVIKPYDETAWAELYDGRGEDVVTSLVLLEALHRRWVGLLRSLDDAQWQRRLRHPETGVHDLATVLQLYAWHGRHHLAQITGAVRVADAGAAYGGAI